MYHTQILSVTLQKSHEKLAVTSLGNQGLLYLSVWKVFLLNTI